MKDYENESTYEKAVKTVRAILDSNYTAYHNVIEENCTIYDGDIIVHDVFKLAGDIAFFDLSEPVLEIARDFVLCAMLDEIENGNSNAMVNLGALYYTGRIGQQSYAEAVKYYTMAAEKGDLIACQNLGYCYYYGRDVEVNYEKAYHYFIKPALAGSVEAKYKIGDMYSKGLYVEKDINMAFRLYVEAYNGIDDKCDVIGDICLRMGDCLYYGNGCEIDMNEALFFYQRSEQEYYNQIKKGDCFKKKMLESVIEKQEKIRQKLKAEIDEMSLNDR